LIYAVRDRVTSEKSGELIIMDEGVSDKRLLAIESEFAGPLKTINREGNILSITIRQAWNGRDRVSELIEERGGCELLYLLPYSPDFNPIEEAFAKIKGLLRKAEARTREALVEAMGTAISAVTARDARGFFEHSCYSLQIQSL
jgi:transposase